jgi:hypothetical protein
MQNAAMRLSISFGDRTLLLRGLQGLQQSVWNGFAENIGVIGF